MQQRFQSIELGGRWLCIKLDHVQIISRNANDLHNLPLQQSDKFFSGELRERGGTGEILN